MTRNPHAALCDKVLHTVLDGPGATDPSLRHAAADGRAVPADIQPLVDKIERGAYRVTDDDIAALQARYGDDRSFEIIVSAALGASRRRLQAGLSALEEA